MVSFGGTALKLLQTFLYAVTLLCAAVVLAVYSYFLARLSANDLPIYTWKKAVEGISGAAVLYLIFAVILTCFLGGIGVFAVFAIIVNLLFVGGFVAIIVLTRKGANSCTGIVDTPLGKGSASTGDGLLDDGQNNNYGFNVQPKDTYSPDLGLACRMNKAAFVVAIVAAILFLVLMAVQLLIARKHKEDKQFQAAPGAGKRRFWQRKSRSTNPGTVESGYGATKPESHTYDPHYAGGTGTNYTGTTAAPGSHTSATYDSTGRPIANPYQTGPTGPYTNY